MLKVIRKQACRRCHGHLAVESDIYGVYVQCIQCGATYTEKDLREMVREDMAKALKARAAAGTPAVG
jgi:hypothetical protein